MRSFVRAGWVMVAGAVLFAGPRGLAQDAPGAGQGAGQGARGRGGFRGQMLEGTVVAETPDSVTIKTDAGDSYTVKVSADTRVMKDRQPIKLSEVKVGDGLMAMGQVDAAAKSVQAMMLMDVDAATMQKAKADLGKTYITGKITAIDADNLKLTVQRNDGVSQVIQVDEGTSFQRGPRGIEVPSMFGMGGGRRGGAGGGAAAAPESITLADIKVGDNVVATGALKGGVFVPAKMGVSEPGTGGGMRRGAAEAGQAPPAEPPQ